MLGHDFPDISKGVSAPEVVLNSKEIGTGEGEKGPIDLGGVYESGGVPENRGNQLVDVAHVHEKEGGGDCLGSLVFWS